MPGGLPGGGGGWAVLELTGTLPVDERQSQAVSINTSDLLMSNCICINFS